MPYEEAILDLRSPENNKALYLPRLTSAQRQAIASPQVGALVYDTDLSTLVLYDGTLWMPLVTTSLNAMLLSREGPQGAWFGYSVAMSGDYAIVGAPNDHPYGDNQGAAYVFVRSGNIWTQQARLIARDGNAGDFFGGSVAISGDYVLIGASGDGDGEGNAFAMYDIGAAYVFVRSGSTWTQQAKLLANDGAPYDSFGSGVALSGDYAFIGADGDDMSALKVEQGSAYVFVRSGSTWTQEAKLIADDGDTKDYFGRTVAISGNYLLVGSGNDDVGSNTDQGSVYVFVRSGTAWTQQAKLTASDGASEDYFGASLAISGDYAIIGAYGDDMGANVDQGSAYVFVRSGSTWTQQAKLLASNGSDKHYFGSSVAIFENTAVVGAGNLNGPTGDMGTTYMFRSNNGIWTEIKRIELTRESEDNARVYSVGIYNGSFSFSRMGKVLFGLVE